MLHWAAQDCADWHVPHPKAKARLAGPAGAPGTPACGRCRACGRPAAPRGTGRRLSGSAACIGRWVNELEIKSLRWRRWIGQSSQMYGQHFKYGAWHGAKTTLSPPLHQIDWCKAHLRGLDIIPGADAPPLEKACERRALKHPAVGSRAGRRRQQAAVGQRCRRYATVLSSDCEVDLQAGLSLASSARSPEQRCHPRQERRQPQQAFGRRHSSLS